MANLQALTHPRIADCKLLHSRLLANLNAWSTDPSFCLSDRAANLKVQTHLEAQHLSVGFAEQVANLKVQTHSGTAEPKFFACQSEWRTLKHKLTLGSRDLGFCFPERANLEVQTQSAIAELKLLQRRTSGEPQGAN